MSFRIFKLDGFKQNSTFIPFENIQLAHALMLGSGYVKKNCLIPGTEDDVTAIYKNNKGEGVPQKTEETKGPSIVIGTV